MKKRYESRGIKPRSDRHEIINPVTEAVIRVRIEEDIQRLRTDAGLQVFMGDDAAKTWETGAFIDSPGAREYGFVWKGKLTFTTRWPVE